MGEIETQNLHEQFKHFFTSHAFTGGNPGIEQSLNRMYQQEQPEVVSRGAVDTAVMEYLDKARAALEQSE